MEYEVTHTVVQTVEAATPEEAERIARHGLENSPTLWWPSVLEDPTVKPAGT